MQDHLGLHGQGARDAQALLLAAGQADAGGAQAVLDLVPQAHGAQGVVHAVLQVAAAHARQLQPGGHVVVDGHGGKGVGLLEHHADVAAHGGHVHAGAVDIHVVEQHRALHAGAGRQLVHAVDAADERRLAAAGGADDGRHPVGDELDVDVLEHVGVAVVGVQPLDVDGVAGAGVTPGAATRRGLGPRSPWPCRRLGAPFALRHGHPPGLLCGLPAQLPPASFMERTRDHAEDQHHGDEQQRRGPGLRRGPPGWVIRTG